MVSLTHARCRKKKSFLTKLVLPDRVFASTEVADSVIVFIIILIDGTIAVGVVSGVEVGYGARRDPQDAEDREKNAREHPALSVADGNASRIVILLQNLSAPTPGGGVCSVVIDTVPPPNQDTTLVLDVYESRHLSRHVDGVSFLLKGQLGDLL